jgi:hypothetical protein
VLPLSFPLAAGDSHGRDLAGTEPLPAGHGRGPNCLECFSSRGLSAKCKD